MKVLAWTGIEIHVLAGEVPGSISVARIISHDLQGSVVVLRITPSSLPDQLSGGVMLVQDELGFRTGEWHGADSARHIYVGLRVKCYASVAIVVIASPRDRPARLRRKVIDNNFPAEDNTRLSPSALFGTPRGLE